MSQPTPHTNPCRGLSCHLSLFSLHYDCVHIGSVTMWGGWSQRSEGGLTDFRCAREISKKTLTVPGELLLESESEILYLSEGKLCLGSGRRFQSLVHGRFSPIAFCCANLSSETLWANQCPGHSSLGPSTKEVLKWSPLEVCSGHCTQLQTIVRQGEAKQTRRGRQRHSNTTGHARLTQKCESQNPFQYVHWVSNLNETNGSPYWILGAWAASSAQWIILSFTIWANLRKKMNLSNAIWIKYEMQLFTLLRKVQFNTIYSLLGQQQVRI